MVINFFLPPIIDWQGLIQEWNGLLKVDVSYPWCQECLHRLHTLPLQLVWQCSIMALIQRCRHLHLLPCMGKWTVSSIVFMFAFFLEMTCNYISLVCCLEWDSVCWVSISFLDLLLCVLFQVLYYLCWVLWWQTIREDRKFIESLYNTVSFFIVIASTKYLKYVPLHYSSYI